MPNVLSPPDSKIFSSFSPQRLEKVPDNKIGKLKLEYLLMDGGFLPSLPWRPWEAGSGFASAPACSFFFFFFLPVLNGAFQLLLMRLWLQSSSVSVLVSFPLLLQQPSMSGF